MRDAYIVDAVRTPRGRRSLPKKDFVGEFANIHPALLGATLVDALVERNPSLPPEKVRIFSMALLSRSMSRLRIWEGPLS